ncbi:hypothetical protein ACIPRD_13860 [Streptomyces sp. NPDC090108]|uniref:hypothetical protein n=1 Tax=Streptomyces sp. NPDC090108 TaxID=3365947 RepID=UPI003801D54A
MLTLIAMGRGVLPVGEHARCYHPRPDISYVPLRDTEPIRRGLIRRPDNTTEHVREFVRAAADIAAENNTTSPVRRQ